jgi:hypothetical protein
MARPLQGSDFVRDLGADVHVSVNGGGFACTPHLWRGNMLVLTGAALRATRCQQAAEVGHMLTAAVRPDDAHGVPDVVVAHDQLRRFDLAALAAGRDTIVIADAAGIDGMSAAGMRLVELLADVPDTTTVIFSSGVRYALLLNLSHNPRWVEPHARTLRAWAASPKGPGAPPHAPDSRAVISVSRATVMQARDATDEPSPDVR